MTASPILVASPTTRSGTTLLQRLITSSENGICYGEFCGRRIVELCEFAHRELLLVQHNKERQAHEWTNVLGGNVDYWMVGLDLPDDFASHALAGAVKFYKQHYDEGSRTVGKEIWAAKVPKLSFQQIVKVSDLINDLKCIYIFRNVFDVIKSQKSKGWITSKPKLVAACEEWFANTEVVATLKRNNFENLPAMMHVIEYEQLVADPAGHIAGIEAFTGLRGIRSEVANTKVNAWISKPGDTGAPESAYLTPGHLSRGECEIIDEICSTRMRELYPSLSAEDFISDDDA